MAKTKILFSCAECGAEYPRWSGKCTQCSAWNSLEERLQTPQLASKAKVPTQKLSIQKVSLASLESRRISSGMEECNRVLGGGFMPDGLTLLSGDPGIGKSTLALQTSLKIAAAGKKVLYISGEESVSQISQRAQRLWKEEIPESFHLISAYHLESVLETIREQQADFVVADSVQTFRSDEATGSSGSMSQTRHIAESFMQMAKHQGVSVLLIGHVTKDGNLAGPKVLEHLVDTVLYFEGEKYQDIRLLRALKNRFGSTSEVGIFTMKADGLEEVRNPSEIFLQGRQQHSIGSALTMTLEGSRPFLLEVQGLCSPADFQYPRRTSSGIALNRVHVLLAVLNQHARMKLDKYDVYVNVPGGFRVKDPSVDLAVCAALLSSRLGVALPESTVFLGEVGLSGEVRPVSQQDRRLQELANLGIERVAGAVPKNYKGLECTGMRSIRDLLSFIKSSS